MDEAHLVGKAHGAVSLYGLIDSPCTAYALAIDSSFTARSPRSSRIAALSPIKCAIGTPVGFAMAFSGSIGLLMVGGMATLSGILQTAPLSTVSAYELITIPMFLRRITKESCARFAHAEEKALAKAKEKGIKLIHFSPEDEKTMATVLDRVSQEWASGLDSRGKPGTEALKVWRAALSAAPQGN